MVRRIVVLLVLLAAPVHAQSTNAQAEALFEQGRASMAKGDFAEACSAFEASQKLDPAVSTLLNLAGCRERNGQLASAWALFIDAARQSRESSAPAAREFEKVAVDRSAKLAPRLSKLSVNVASPQTGLEVLRGEDLIPSATWNRSLPIDGGTYTITARAPGFDSWSTTITIASESDAKTVDVPALAPAKPKAVDTSKQQPVVQTPARPRKPARLAGFGLVGVGGAAIATSFVLGALARSKWNDAKAVCGDALECDSDELNVAVRATADDAKSRGNLATIFGIAGVASVAGGVVLLVVTRDRGASDRVSIQPTLEPTRVGIQLDARF